MPEQIAILLALTAKLFDPVPIERMNEAEQAAVRAAAATIPDAITAHFETADTLSDEDRAAVVEMARKALAGFLPDTPSREKT